MDDELYVRCNGPSYHGCKCIHNACVLMAFMKSSLITLTFMSPFVPTTHTESGSEAFDLACTGDEEGGVSSPTDERNEDICQVMKMLM